MSDNKVFHLKYRCSDFNEIIGNESTVNGIQKLLETGETKSFLLYGERGCGKTTVARIMTKYLGVKSQRDIVEMDIADVGIKDKARELKKVAKYASLAGGNKVYIFDECQESSSGFQQGILKILEEPPPNSYFILCTTNPEKLNKAIRSRCSAWKFSLLNHEDSETLIKNVCMKERLRINIAEKRKIIEKSDGSPREILVILQQIAGIETSEERLDIINNYFSEDTAEVVELCKMLIAGSSWKQIAVFLKKFKGDPEGTRRAILGYMTAVLLNNGEDRVADIIEMFKESFFYSGKSGLVQACYYCTKL